MRYRRAYVPGAAYFFTVNTLERHKTLLTDHIDLLRQSLRSVKQRHSFRIDAMVVLPDHLHAVWTLPEGDDDFSKRWRLIKAAFSRGLPAVEAVQASRQNKGERGIWQRRFWEHLIRDENDFSRHVDYVHINPVKHGHVDSPVEWQYSSIHKWIQDEAIDDSWGSTEDFNATDFGEMP